MSGLSKPLNWCAGVALGVALTTSLFGQSPTGRRAVARGKVTRMEIFDGSRQTVRYFSDNVSPGESSTLRDVERLENEMSYLNNLQALKSQYVTSERLMETHRRIVQRQLYGQESTRSTYGSVVSNYGYGGYNYPSFGLNGYGNYGYGNSGTMATAGDSSTVTQTLADGVGPEGKIKEAMATVLASQATPEYASKIDRAYDVAMMRASSSPTLAVALGVRTDAESRRRDGNLLAGAEMPLAAPVVVTLQDGERILGDKITEKGDFYVVDKANGSEEVRKTAVMRIQRGKGSGVVPITP